MGTVGEGAGGGEQAAGDAYLKERGINDIVANLLRDVAKSKPEDHLMFMRRWLASPAARRDAAGSVSGEEQSKSTRGDGAGTEDSVVSGSGEGESVPDFALFRPTKRMSTVSWAAGIPGVDDNQSSTRTTLTFSRHSIQHCDSVNLASSSNNSVLQNTSILSQDMSMWVPASTPARAQPPPANSALPVSPAPQDATGSCSDLPPLVKKIVEGVQALPPSDLTAVMAFIDGLSNKAMATRLGRRLSNTATSFVTNFNLESCGPTTSDGGALPCFSLLPDESSSAGADAKLSSHQRLQLVGDALTTSIVAGTNTGGREERAGQLSFSNLHSAVPVGFRLRRGSSVHMGRLSGCFPANGTTAPGVSSGGFLPVFGEGTADLSQMFPNMDESGANPVSFIQHYMQRSRLSSTISWSCGDYAHGATVDQEEEVSALRRAFSSCERFSTLSVTDVEVIARNTHRLDLAVGQTCNFTDAMLYVYSGLLHLENNEGVVREFPAGTFLDARQCELLRNVREPLEMRAKSESVVLVLKDDALRAIQRNEKRLKRQMFVDCLRKSPLFAAVPLGLLKTLASYMHVRTMAQGKVVLRRGEHVSWFSVIMSGTVERTEGSGGEADEALPAASKKFSTCSSGPLNMSHESHNTFGLGEFELLFNLPMLTDVVATTPVAVVRVCTAFLHSLLPLQAINDMKYVVATSASVAPLQAMLSDELRQSVKMFTDHHSQSKRVGGGQLVRRFSLNSNVSTSTRGLSDNARQGVLSSGSKTPTAEVKRKVSSAGEIVYAGKRNHYRFPIAALDLVNIVIVAVVSDGTVIRWNDAAERITGLQRQRVLGQSVFSSLTTDAARRSLREQLKLVRSVAGNWSSYVSCGFSTPQVYRFRQPSGSHSVGLLLSVVPSAAGSSEDVLLLLGREADNHAMASYVEETTRWLNDVLRPQLSAFQRRVREFEEKKWDITPDEGTKLRGYVEACKQLMDRYTRLAGLNKRSTDALWKPVRVQHVLQQFVGEVMPEVQRAGNRLTTDAVAGPKGEVFLHVECVRDLLRGIVLDANKNKPNYHIHVAVEAVLPTTTSSDSTAASYQEDVCASFASRTDSTSNVSQVSSAMFRSTTSPAIAGASSGRLRSICSHRQLGKWPVYMRFIHFIFTCSPSGSTPPDAAGGVADRIAAATADRTAGATEPHKGFCAGKECEDLVAAMGGEIFLEQGDTKGPCRSTIVELPLLPTPWEEEEDEDEVPTSSTTGPPFSVVVADKNEKERSNICKLLWARRHSVFSVSSLSGVMMGIEKPDIGLLIIDPCNLDMTDGESEAWLKAPYPFNMDHAANHFVVLIYTEDFDDWRVQKMKKCGHVIDLPKPATTSLLHSTLYEAECMAIRVREYEERVTQMRSAFREFQPERYEMGKVLGRGSHGEVYEVVDRLTGGKLAMKRMTLSDGLLAADVAEEFLSVTSMRHKNMIHYFYCEQESENVVRLYMELASGGTLKDKIRQNGGPLPLATIVQYLGDLCDGLAYIHSSMFVHGDIKTANVLVDQYGRVKIGDFGTARRLKRKSDKICEVSGTPRFMAPEQINADATLGIGYDQKGDIWSLGCVALELATGMVPFAHIEEAQGMGIFNFLINLKETPDLSVIQHIDADFYAFVRSCLQVDPKDRPTSHELSSHSLLQRAGTSMRDLRLAQQIQVATKLHEYAALEDGNSDDENDDDDDDDMFVECDFAPFLQDANAGPSGEQGASSNVACTAAAAGGSAGEEAPLH